MNIDFIKTHKHKIWCTPPNVFKPKSAIIIAIIKAYLNTFMKLKCNQPMDVLRKLPRVIYHGFTIGKSGKSDKQLCISIEKIILIIFTFWENASRNTCLTNLSTNY